MERAAILIGVSRSGDLPPLKATGRAVHAVADWALAQGMRPELVRTLTDDDGPVEVTAIKRAVREITERATVEQLLVYFSGHGVNLSYGERWLLSDAPGDTQAAVNVEGSIQLARWCGVPHVVLISDACRTAAEGVRAQAVTGSEVFPNVLPDGPERSVDVFFGCTLGRPSYEIRDVHTAAAGFDAVYTSALVDALSGRRRAVVDTLRQGGGTLRVVRPRRLKEFLPAEVAQRLRDAGVAADVWQTPDARVTSADGAWLARLGEAPGGEVPGGEVPGGEVPGGDEEPESWQPPAPPSTLPEASELLIHLTLADGRAPEPRAWAGVPGAGTMLSVLDRVAEPFGPGRFETGCGFKVRGAAVAGAYARRAAAEIIGPDRALVRVGPAGRRPEPVLLTFAGGRGTVLPAIPGFIGGLTFVDGELADVAYEPSDNSGRWPEFRRRAGELRSLRALIAATAQMGTFRLAPADAAALARRMRVAKGIDPTMAVYAAYAYDRLPETGRIRVMERFLADDLGLRLFDVSLLAGRAPGPDVLPFAPLLSPGWALLGARRVTLPPAAAALHRHLVPSLWSLYRPAAAALLRRAVDTQEEA